MDDFKSIQPPMYNILQHNEFPKPSQFPTYNNNTDFVSNPLEHEILESYPKYSSPSNVLNEFRDIEPMWSLPKFSSYEALLNDHEDILMDGYNLINDNVMYVPTAMRNGGNELSHFTSLQNLVYPI